MHKAKAVAILCIDFRFQLTYQNFLRDNNYLGVTDEITIAGASRDFISPVKKRDGEYAWKQLNLSMKLHDPEEILIFDHQDCGGYAQDNMIPFSISVDLEYSYHSKYLNSLREELLKHYPNKTVKLFFVKLDGEIIKLNT